MTLIDIAAEERIPVSPIISKRLKGLMVEHEVTTCELSRRVGIPKNILAMKINGRREWLYREMVSITKLFGFSEVKMTFPELYSSVMAQKS
jgi:hypothetical protein